MRAHVEATPAPPSSRNPAVPPALDEIVRKALAKDPAMRFQSEDEFRLALQNAAAVNRPVVATSSPQEREHPALPPLTSRLTVRLRGLGPSRAVLLMTLVLMTLVLTTLVPAALVAGFYAIRFFPAAASVHATESKTRSAAVSKHDLAPAPPVIASQVEPVVSAIVPPSQPLEPAEAEEPAVTARHRAPSAPPTVRQPGKPLSSYPIRYPIRVTGGDPQASAAMPAPTPAPRPVEAPELLVPVNSGVETQEGESGIASIEAAPDLAPATQKAAPAKAQNAGNRFVRALGKLNRFHKGARHDDGEASKTPLDKD